jgi:hypothetical protein
MDLGSHTLAGLQQLQNWIITGWRIEEPVLQRNVYHALDGRVCVFEVVLCRCGERRAIALHDEPDVHRFLHEQGLRVLEVA